MHRLRGEFAAGRGGLPRGQPAGAGSRSPAWRCCGWRRGRRRRGGGDPPGRWTRPATVLERAGLLPALRRDHARRRRRRGRRAPPADELAEIAARPPTRRCCGAMAAHARGAVLLAEGDAAGAPWSRCAARGRRGRSSRRPTRPRASRVLLGLACRQLGDEDTRRDGARRGALRLRSSSAPAPDLARVERSPGAAPAGVPAG